MLPVNQILIGDCIQLMSTLPEASIDLIFADPPYNLQLNNPLHRPDTSLVVGVHEAWDHFNSLQEYDHFTKNWLRQCKRLLKPNGALWVIGSYHNIFRIGYILQDLGFWLLNDIIWVKNNPTPNFRGTRFTNAHETLLWAIPHKESKYTFHYHDMKALNDDLQMRSDWHLPICSGKERLKDDEAIRIHSTQKPESLLYYIISSTTNSGDTILDPFFGSGTTGAVAKKMGRNFIGIEQNETYIVHAQKRLDSISTLAEASFALPHQQKILKIPIGQLIAGGLLQPGTVFYDKRAQIQATLLHNGQLRSPHPPHEEASIHKMPALLTTNPMSVNGWLFWYIKDEKGQLISIDTIRKIEMKKQLSQRH